MALLRQSNRIERSFHICTMEHFELSLKNIYRSSGSSLQFLKSCNISRSNVKVED
jgi:hypothetical protein